MSEDISVTAPGAMDDYNVRDTIVDAGMTLVIFDLVTCSILQLTISIAHTIVAMGLICFN